MTGRRSRTVLWAAAAVAGAVLAAGCGTAGPSTRPPATRAAAPAAALNTSLVNADGTWAVAVMGGSAEHLNDFWQLFVRSPGSARWRLVTPPGTADNGGLVLAAGAPAVITAFRPSKDLTFTPLIRTIDGGRAWSPLSPLGGALAGYPDALAVRPGGGLLALLGGQTATMTSPGYSDWKTLVTRPALAATAAGRQCEPTSITAAAFTAAGAPLLGGACSRSGSAGIFAESGGSWHAAGPVLPAAFAGQAVTVLRLVRVGSQLVALIKLGTGRGAGLLVAWSARRGGWSLAPLLRLGGGAVSSSSFGTGGSVAVELTGSRGAVVSPGRQWTTLPTLPAGTMTLAAGPVTGTLDALAVHHSVLSVWQLGQGAAAWAKTQTMKVPILYGSSG